MNELWVIGKKGPSLLRPQYPTARCCWEGRGGGWGGGGTERKMQTPGTGLRHPSFGGRCRKAMLGVCGRGPQDEASKRTRKHQSVLAPR